MLVVKVEVWPGGDESCAREVGRMDVGNVTELAEDSEYVYRVDSDTWHPKTIAHKRSDGAWELVRKVLNRVKEQQ